ncbi:MAG: hypothetical protein EAZ08_04565 [Cytophagales bacterium]|nr:MAG: hypothetical protein EAZ08_04565 [Cytophagales bacterium]
MKKICLIHLFLMIVICTQAQDAIVLKNTNQLIDISSFTYFFEDKNDAFSIEKTSDIVFVSKFIKTSQEIPNFGVVPYPIWCKFTLHNLSSDICFLMIDNPAIDSLTLYIPMELGGFTAKRAGYYLPNEQRELNANALVFSLPHSTVPQTYYLRIVTKNNTTLPIKVGSKNVIWHQIANTYWIDALYMGLLLFVIAYNAFMYFSLRESSYGYYVLYGIGLLLNACYNLGYISIFGGYVLHFAIEYSYFTVGLPSIAAILFTTSFLQTAKYFPQIHLVFKVFLLILTGFFAVDFFRIFTPHTLRYIFNITALLLITCLLYAGIHACKQKFLPARYFLLAWGGFMFFAVWLIFIYLNILPSPIFVGYQLQLGSAFEMLFLSFALADRIRQSEEEKMMMQTKLVATVQDRELIINEQKLELEKNIKERIHELQRKQDEILGQNEELTQQQAELFKQQQLIEQKNKELTLLNKKMLTNELVLRKAYSKISDAKQMVADKNKELEVYSENLEQQIRERTQQITQANAELIKQNNQLEQFAFITAHNLRAPVARLLGLSSILDLENKQNPDNEYIIGKMALVSNELDTVIKDLNIILEIKKGVNEIISNVKLSDKLAKVCGLLENQIIESQAIITSDFSAIDVIESVNPYIESIIYNLVSNAIKYRSYKRIPQIHLQTTVEKNSFLLTVADNGLGMNLSENKAKIFGLYRRFHDHVEGKGLGLYLVKTQIEALGGSIEIESIPGEGTTFYLSFKKYN